MPIITSPTNETIKSIKKLQLKKYRAAAGQFVVENAVIIHDAIAAGFIPRQLFMTAAAQSSGDKRIRDILQACSDVTTINERANKAFSTLATPAGIAAVFDQPQCVTPRKTGVTLYLNAITDPGNLGTILRTACAFNVANVIVDEHCVDVYNPKTIQAAKESIFKLNICEDKNLRLFKQLKETVPVVATDMRGTPLHQSAICDLKSAIMLVFGNESNGVSTTILNEANETISLPMSGDIESLNVAVSAGIILYNLTTAAI